MNPISPDPAAPAPGLAAARVIAVCVGRVKPLFDDPEGRGTIVSGIAKRAVSTLDAPAPVAVGTLGLDGDEQADPTVHGGIDKAVYAYPVEHYAFWTRVRGQAGRHEPLAWGAMGENLAIEGLAETRLWVGDRLHIGEAEFFVTSPRQPCFKFDAIMGFRQASKMMVQSGFTGFYLSVVRQGRISAGDAIEVTPGDRMISLSQHHAMSNRTRQRVLL